MIVTHGRAHVVLDPAVWRKWRVIPGVAPQRVPIELLESMGYAPYLPPCVPYTPWSDAKPWQVQAVEFILSVRRCIVAAETGLGKTKIAIDAREALGATRVLVIAPAIALPVWQAEIAKWELAQCQVKCNGPVFNTHDVVYMLYSYSQAHKIPPDLAVDYLILDEIHSAKTHGATAARQSKAVRALANRHKGAIVGLSATPMTVDPLDLYGQLDLLYPGRFGSFWDYRKAYAERTPCQYALGGYSYKGLNERRAKELEQRLQSVMLRITKDSIDTIKPVLEVKAGLSILHEVAQAHKTKQVAVITYNKALARQLHKAIDGSVLISGQSVASRTKAINEARRGCKVIVASMGSIAQAIDLTFVQQAYFVQLYAAPGFFQQVLGRFARLNSTHRPTLTLLVEPGSLEEVYAYRLVDRCLDQQSLMAASSSQTLITESMQMTDDQILAKLRESAGEIDSELTDG